MAAWALVQAAVFPLVVVLIPGARVARALARQPEPLAVQAARPALRALLVLHLLLAGCLGKAAAVAVVVLLALGVLAVLEAVALAAVAVVQHAVHTLLAPVA